MVDKRKEAMWQEYVESLRLLEGERDRGGSGNSREGITHTAGEAAAAGALCRAYKARVHPHTQRNSDHAQLGHGPLSPPRHCAR